MKAEKKQEMEAKRMEETAEAPDTGELSDDSLDQVAGGLTSSNQTIFAVKKEKM